VAFGASKGLGQLSLALPSEVLRSLLASEYAFTILYNPAWMATKSSILLFYLQIAKGAYRLWRIASYVTLAVVNVGGIVATLLSALRCSPVRRAYEIGAQNLRCISIIDIYLASAPLNIATNILILVLPIAILSKLHMDPRKKAIIVFLFALGIFVTVIDVVRIYYLQLAAKEPDAHSIGLGHYTAGIAFLWSAVDVNVGIMCACIPVMKPVIMLMVPHSVLRPVSQHSSESKPSAAFRTEGPPYESKKSRPQEPLTIPLGSPGLPGPQRRRPRAHSGHVTMIQFRCILYTRGRESLKYNATVSTIYFISGFTYGILTSLNSQRSNVANRSTVQAVNVVTVFYGGYFVGPMLLSRWVLPRFGFKTTMLTGLCIYFLGTLIFWPAGALGSYPTFVLSNFAVGFGLGIVDSATNPFACLCGAPQYADFRLQIVQGLQTVASLFSGLLSRLVFKVSVVSIQWVYLSCSLAVVLLALFIYFVNLPESSDEELQEQLDDLNVQHPQQQLIGGAGVTITAFVLVAFLLCLVNGATQSVDILYGFVLASASRAPHTSQVLTTNNVYLAATGLYASGRFLFAFLSLVITPRLLVLVSLTGTLLFSALMAWLTPPNVNFLSIAGVVYSFFEGPLFSHLFAMGIRGLGRRTKRGSVLLMSSYGFGGAVFPYIMWAVANTRSYPYSLCVIVALYATACVTILCMNLIPTMRYRVDPVNLRSPSDNAREEHGRRHED
jgi:fucose permease